jgi:hypothetical protein
MIKVDFLHRPAFQRKSPLCRLAPPRRKTEWRRRDALGPKRTDSDGNGFDTGFRRAKVSKSQAKLMVIQWPCGHNDPAKGTRQIRLQSGPERCDSPNDRYRPYRM